MSFEDLPDNAFVSWKQLQNIVPKSRATIYRWVEDGTFPKPKRIGPNSSAWRLGEVRAWLASREVAS